MACVKHPTVADTQNAACLLALLIVMGHPSPWLHDHAEAVCLDAECLDAEKVWVTDR